MKQITVVSGKGGTGKTTVAACLARLAQPVVTADGDVDAANLALLLPGPDRDPEDFFAGERAEVDADACNGCGACVDACRFDAVALDGTGIARVNTQSCEGCRVCQMVCTEDAVSMHPNQAGHLLERRTGVGPLVHARLGIAQDNSGKLVAMVRSRARETAEAEGLDLVLVDGPPGIGCPVHAAITGADLLLAVTEPTPSGVHDLERLLELAKRFELRVAVLINKVDLSETFAAEVERLAEREGATVVGRLPFDPEVPRMLARGEVPLGLESWARELGAVWERVRALLNGAGAPSTTPGGAGV